MASVTFPTELGGNGQTYTDNADPETGLDGLGYTVRFIPCLKQAVAMGLSAQSNASAAASYVQQCQTLRQEVAADRQSVAADRAHVDQQKGLVDTATEEAQQSAANVNADNIVHKPGSGLPNEAGDAYSRNAAGVGALYARGGILDAVSQSSGVPTGGLFELVTNVNGEYLKLPDGTLFMIAYATLNLKVSDNQDFSYPYMPVPGSVVGCMSLTDSSPLDSQTVFASAVLRTADGIWRAVVTQPVGTVNDVNVSLFAKARWY